MKGKIPWHEYIVRNLIVMMDSENIINEINMAWYNGEKKTDD